MADIRCRVCGEPWDSYGVYHGDMDDEGRQIFLAGKGCPCCHGVKPVYCELDNSSIPVDCNYFVNGKCKHAGKCDHKIRSDDKLEDFLSDLTDSANTDDEPIKLLSNVKP